MHYNYKDHSYANTLTHSAVYRAASPSPNKFARRPSSKYSQTDQANLLKLNGSFCSPQTTKKGYLRNTVDATKSFSSLNNQASETNKNIHKIDEFQAPAKTQRSPFNTISSNQRIAAGPNSKHQASPTQNKTIQSSKPNFQSQQPLFNKIIKKIDDKQKLLTELKKLAETQLPTRLRKNNNHTKPTLNLNTLTDRTLKQASFLSLSFVATKSYEQNSLKQKYLNNVVTREQGQFVKNPIKEKQAQVKPIYFTPKTTKYCGIENDNKIISTSAITASKYSTPQTVKSINTTNNAMKKKSINTFEVKSSLLNQILPSPIQKISSNEALRMSKSSLQKAKLSDFKIMRNLGQGKFGTVFEVIHKESNFMFAMKRISKQNIKSHLMTQQLILQIRIQSFCNHKNIVKIYAVFDDNEHLYLLLEYMEEGTLFNHLKKNKTLKQEDAAIKVKQVAEAVKYLHQNGIAHRDIKPQNIVLSNGVGKLCDFGWAALCNQRRRTYCGTFDYAAPEILEGSEYDMSVDMWCLGVLAYELLVGKAPFYHISRKQTMKKIMNVSPQNIEFPGNVSANAVDFIKKLLIKQPEERMTAQAVLKHPFLSQVSQ